MTTLPLLANLRRRTGQCLLAVLCALSLIPGDTAIYAQPTALQNGSTDQAAPTIPGGQLDSLVAPIALYPDPLLTQVLVASTYPLEIIQLQQWLQRNSNLKGDDLTNAVEKQDWDPSIQSMAIFPDLVKRLADDIKWTTDLGNAFLAQQEDVMDAVQRMRKKAMDAGNLKSSEQQTVQTKMVETKTVVVIQPASPQVVYVPVYSPVVVYGPPVYPYPPIYYPPPSYYPAGVFIAFGAGVAYGSYYRGGWGYGCAWGYSRTTININVNNRYVSHYNSTNINTNRPRPTPYGNGNTWQHNTQHRGGTPYPNQQVAKQYGGTARGDSMSTRQTNARQQQGAVNRQQPSASTGSVGSANRPGANTGARPSNAGSTAANRPASNSGTRSGNGSANQNSTGNNIGNRQVPNNTPSGNTSAFGGASSKASAQASSARGAASMGASRGGGTRSGSSARPR
ncbi:MAG: DUF3300 domain-containing protein [Candidatus Acidiferrum sp.]